MGDIHDDLREVMGLLGKATPGPWAHTKRNDPEAPASIASGMDRGMAYAVAMCPRFRGDDWHKDADAIVSAVAFLRQHGPALLARQEGEEGWLPIESAPKDGTYILLFGDMEQPYVSNYDTFRDGFGDRYTGWVSPDAGELGPGLMSPTHWRPLPALPAARSGGGGGG